MTRKKKIWISLTGGLVALGSVASIAASCKTNQTTIQTTIELDKATSVAFVNANKITFKDLDSRELNNNTNFVLKNKVAEEKGYSISFVSAAKSDNEIIVSYVFEKPNEKNMADNLVYQKRISKDVFLSDTYTYISIDSINLFKNKLDGSKYLDINYNLLNKQQAMSDHVIQEYQTKRIEETLVDKKLILLFKYDGEIYKVRTPIYWKNDSYIQLPAFFFSKNNILPELIAVQLDNGQFISTPPLNNLFLKEPNKISEFLEKPSVVKVVEVIKDKTKHVVNKIKDKVVSKITAKKTNNVDNTNTDNEPKNSTNNQPSPSTTNDKHIPTSELSTNSEENSGTTTTTVAVTPTENEISLLDQVKINELNSMTQQTYDKSDVFLTTPTTDVYVKDQAQLFNVFVVNDNWVQDYLQPTGYYLITDLKNENNEPVLSELASTTVFTNHDKYDGKQLTSFTFNSIYLWNKDNFSITGIKYINSNSQIKEVSVKFTTPISLNIVRVSNNQQVNNAKENVFGVLYRKYANDTKELIDNVEEQEIRQDDDRSHSNEWKTNYQNLKSVYLEINNSLTNEQKFIKIYNAYTYLQFLEAKELYTKLISDINTKLNQLGEKVVYTEYYTWLKKYLKTTLDNAVAEITRLYTDPASNEPPAITSLYKKMYELLKKYTKKPLDIYANTDGDFIDDYQEYARTRDEIKNTIQSWDTKLESNKFRSDYAKYRSLLDFLKKDVDLMFAEIESDPEHYISKAGELENQWNRLTRTNGSSYYYDNRYYGSNKYEPLVRAMQSNK
ncbi:hypothetical protein OF377_01605 [Ureaplasma sp. ES3154-GEN]|uniref:Vmc-like lipoprotein signal peptide domain-containing protein n=1 Tax=Ureaplasma sp. ES3154-GEN TaxID=2984844 RepID=UPI0021E8EB86|nr:hypothetical protein [Ureaplasma sp. ES3154-GEN]MCV3743582.1 hypothetical protein [Ureaplasma sp. ES3154-GEN]